MIIISDDSKKKKTTCAKVFFALTMISILLFDGALGFFIFYTHWIFPERTFDELIRRTLHCMKPAWKEFFNLQKWENGFDLPSMKLLVSDPSRRFGLFGIIMCIVSVACCFIILCTHNAGALKMVSYLNFALAIYVMLWMMPKFSDIASFNMTTKLTCSAPVHLMLMLLVLIVILFFISVVSYCYAKKIPAENSDPDEKFYDKLKIYVQRHKKFALMTSIISFYLASIFGCFIIRDIENVPEFKLGPITWTWGEMHLFMTVLSAMLIKFYIGLYYIDVLQYATCYSYFSIVTLTTSFWMCCYFILWACQFRIYESAFSNGTASRKDWLQLMIILASGYGFLLNLLNCFSAAWFFRVQEWVQKDPKVIEKYYHDVHSIGCMDCLL